MLLDGTVQFKMRQWHGTWRWLVHEDSGSETEGMTTEVADEHSVYIESLGGRYVWDEARSCWLEVDRVRRLEHDPPHCSVDTPPEVRPWPPLQWQCGLQGARPSTCASDGPREECAEGGTL